MDTRLDSDCELLLEPLAFRMGLENDVLLEPDMQLLVELMGELLPDWILGLCTDPRREPDSGVEALDCD